MDNDLQNVLPTKEELQPKLYPGYWNGEPARFRVVNILVGDEPEEQKKHFEATSPHLKRYLWFKAFIGQVRQAVEVHYCGEVWYLDNFDGSGLYKVREGLGSPRVGHSSIYPNSVVDEVEKDQWERYSEDKRNLKDQQVKDYWTRVDPVGYAEHEKMMERFKDSLRANWAKFRPRP